MTGGEVQYLQSSTFLMVGTIPVQFGELPWKHTYVLYVSMCMQLDPGLNADVMDI